MKDTKEINSIADTLEQVSGAEKLRRIAELKEKAMLDDKAALDYATEKGLTKGRAEGLAEGMVKGIEKERHMLITTMFKNGATIDSLEKLTGLDRKELEEILNICK